MQQIKKWGLGALTSALLATGISYGQQSELNSKQLYKERIELLKFRKTQKERVAQENALRKKKAKYFINIAFGLDHVLEENIAETLTLLNKELEDKRIYVNLSEVQPLDMYKAYYNEAGRSLKNSFQTEADMYVGLTYLELQDEIRSMKEGEFMSDYEYDATIVGFQSPQQLKDIIYYELAKHLDKDLGGIDSKCLEDFTEQDQDIAKKTYKNINHILENKPEKENTPYSFTPRTIEYHLLLNQFPEEEADSIIAITNNILSSTFNIDLVKKNSSETDIVELKDLTRETNKYKKNVDLVLAYTDKKFVKLDKDNKVENDTTAIGRSERDQKRIWVYGPSSSGSLLLLHEILHYLGVRHDMNRWSIMNHLAHEDNHTLLPHVYHQVGRKLEEDYLQITGKK